MVVEIFRLTSSRSKGPDLSTLPGESRLPDAAQAMAHVWNDKYGRFYDRTYRVMYDAGINETGGRTGNTSHVSCGVDVVRAIVCVYQLPRISQHGCASGPERLANKCHFVMCQTCDMDEPIHDDTGRETFGFHGIAWNDPIRSD